MGHPADTMYPITPSAALILPKAKDHLRRKGLNDENHLYPASGEKCFLLTLPFIEPGGVARFIQELAHNEMPDGLHQMIELPTLGAGNP